MKRRFFSRGLKKTLGRMAMVVLLSFVATVAVAKAAPFALPGPTGYTLEDIYNKYVNNIDAAAGNHAFAPAGGPSASPVTIADIMEAEPFIPPAVPPLHGRVLSTGGARTDGLVRDYTVDSGAGTVIDNNTGLMWKRCEEGKSGASCTGSGDEMTWANAIDRCENLSFAGYDDWYLPTIEELTSIVDYTEHSPAIDTAAFPNTESAITWSSTEDVSSSTNAWIVNFSYGTPSNYPKTNSSRVRCVRKQKPEDSETYGLTLVMTSRYPDLNLVTIESTPPGISCTGSEGTMDRKVCSARFEKDAVITLSGIRLSPERQVEGCDSGGMYNDDFCVVNLGNNRTITVGYFCPLGSSICPI